MNILLTQLKSGCLIRKKVSIVLNDDLNIKKSSIGDFSEPTKSISIPDEFLQKRKSMDMNEYNKSSVGYISDESEEENSESEESCSENKEK